VAVEQWGQGLYKNFTLFFVLKHLLLEYDRLIRATVPVIIKENLQTQTKFYLLLSFDIDANVKDTGENELLSYIDKNLELFN
jgi:hypothetical protein